MTTIKVEVVVSANSLIVWGYGSSGELLKLGENLSSGAESLYTVAVELDYDVLKNVVDISLNNSDDLLPITVRQQEVLNLIQQGKANKQIANELKISINTVKAHLNALYKTYNVNSRMQLVYSTTKKEL